MSKRLQRDLHALAHEMPPDGWRWRRKIWRALEAGQ